MPTTKMSLSFLNRINRDQIKLAGARYTPGVDSNAPNVEIKHLVQAFDALAISKEHKSTLRKFREELTEAYKGMSEDITKSYGKCVRSPSRIIALLKKIESAKPGSFGENLFLLKRTTLFANRLVEKSINEFRNLSLDAKEHSEEKRGIDDEIHKIQKLSSAINSISEYVDSPAFKLLNDNCLFLTGEWGTGKTHFFCDLTNIRMGEGLPTLFMLAHHIPVGAEPLDQICQAFNIPLTQKNFLESLQKLGEKCSQRTLLLIDGINEGDRDGWRKAISKLAVDIKKYSHIGLAISCRQPFDRQIMTPSSRKKYVTVHHRGFEENEFNAQMEFFKYYNIPLPQFPLLTEEFSRPLFLKIACLAFQNLSDRVKKQRFKEISSGQKGMTYVFEFFIQNMGRQIEADFDLRPGACWNILKGAKINTNDNKRIGIAVLMANKLLDYVDRPECEKIFTAHTNLTTRTAIKKLITRFIADGLLAEDLTWKDGKLIEVIRLPYQRFSDHLIARHLLSTYLNVSNKNTISRSFYKNRPLGKVFILDRSENYSMPGWATAIMLEFPERIKRVAANDQERELVYYLPRRNQKLAPLYKSFIDGLAWRSSDSFSNETRRIIGLLLKVATKWARNNILEEIVGLASRTGHPISSKSFYSNLSKMPMPERDLYWGEYLRKTTSHSVVYRLLDWIDHIGIKNIDDDTAENLIYLLSLFLTTVKRSLRDKATKALYVIGLEFPAKLFDHTLKSLDYNDIYLPERMLASSYGVSMGSWADSKKIKFHNSITDFSKKLAQSLFLPSSQNKTRHVMVNDYALGIITLSRKLNPNCIATKWVKYLKPPFKQTPSPFPNAKMISDDKIKDTKRAIQMDFENYTIGHLVPERRNYDMGQKEYKNILRQIRWRIVNLGYTKKRFEKIDGELLDYNWSSRGHPMGKIDRYGKKYSWIAFFEMYGIQADKSRINEYHIDECRPSECGIDPSFPEGPRTWQPKLKQNFQSKLRAPVEWLKKGSKPDYSHLVCQNSIEDKKGPWILLNGYIQENSKKDDREIFTFLRGLLLNKNDLDSLKTKFLNKDYPGNHAIPEPWQDYYTYAGEIPWSVNYGSDSRYKNGVAKRNIQSALSASIQVKKRRLKAKLDYWQLVLLKDEKQEESGEKYVYVLEYKEIPGVLVEVPVHTYSWESYHSELNQVSGIDFPAPAICEVLGLTNRVNTLDLYDSKGRQATLYREFKHGENPFNSRLLYIRDDLLKKYLSFTNQITAWVNWGERNFHYKKSEKLRARLPDEFNWHDAIHKQFIVLDKKGEVSICS